jgi:hypothetical protein
VWSQAVTKVGSTDPKKVIDTIKADEWDTVLGKMAFDSKGDIKGAAYIVYKWDAKGYDVRRSDLSQAKRPGPPGRSVSETPLDIVCLARIWLFDAHRRPVATRWTYWRREREIGRTVTRPAELDGRAVWDIPSANMLKRGARSNSASTSAVEDQKLAGPMNGDEITTATPAAKGLRAITMCFLFRVP